MRPPETEAPGTKVRPRTHYLNADFDLGLRPRPRQVAAPAIVQQVRELSVQAMLGVRDGDAALVRAGVPEEFGEYLASCGVAVPRLLVHPRIDAASSFLPFGWSAEALELNRLHAVPTAHPPPACIRRVNSRSFALELEREVDPDGPSGTIVDSAASLEAALSSTPDVAQWVVKAEHGHAGMANLRLHGPRLSAVERGWVEARLAEDDRLLVEPWLDRERDWCAVFEVPFEAATLRVYEVECTAGGVTIGARFDPAGLAACFFAEPLAVASARIASRLEHEGYFGPVCLDAFGWHAGDRVRLRPLVDLNCRHPVSDGAYRLWRSLAPDRAAYYRFFSRRKLSLPGGMPEARRLLGALAYDRQQRRGVLLASPPWLEIDGSRVRPRKPAVLFVAADRGEIDRMERRFRERFEE